MLPYYLAFATLLGLAALSHYRETSPFSAVWLFTSAVLLIGFAGLRSVGVGFDDANYVRAFLAVPPVVDWLSGEYIYSWDTVGMEPLYLLVGAVVRQFTENYTFLFIAIAIISVGITIYSYRIYSIYPGLSVIVYYSHTFLYRDMNQIRAGVAAAIGLFLVKQLYEKRRLAAVGTVAVASAFHLAALSLLLPIFLSYFRITRRAVILALIFALFIGVIGVSPFLISMVPDIGVLSLKIKRYYYESAYGYELGVLDITNIKNISILLASIVLWNKARRNDKLFGVLVLFYALAVTWRVAFSDFAIFAARIATFFGIVEPILVANLAFSIAPKYLAIAAVCCYALAMLVLNLVVRDTSEYVSVLF